MRAYKAFCIIAIDAALAFFEIVEDLSSSRWRDLTALSISRLYVYGLGELDAKLTTHKRIF